MTPKDIFGIIIRTFGLYLLLRAILMAPDFFQLEVGSIRPILLFAFYFAVGWWLLGGAKLLMTRAYPTSAEKAEQGA